MVLQSAEQQILIYMVSLEHHLVLVMIQQPLTFLQSMMTFLFEVGAVLVALTQGEVLDQNKLLT